MVTIDDKSQAISAALSGDWKKAISLNLGIIKKDSKDTEAWNRLGRAYMEIGPKTKAKEAYEKVLRLDKFNNIAARNLELLKVARPIRGGSKKSASLPAFLEEPGITKTVLLARSGDPKVTTHMHPGDEVKIVARQHCVSIINDQDQNIGRLPDDLAARMQNFLREGNTYAAWIRSVDQKGEIKIFIKELTRAPKFRTIPSFPLTEKLSYAAFTPPELVHTEKPDVSSTEEQDNPLARETDGDDDTLPTDLQTADDE